jgi:hypothetical protein
LIVTGCRASRACCLSSLATLCCAAVAFAQDRPSEAEMFAAPQPSEQSDRSAEHEDLKVPATAIFGNDTATADPITIGGQVYLRTQTTALLGQEIEDYTFSVPALLDVFLDARPNERVRGFALGRMSYDPMLPDNPNGLPRVGTTATDNGTSGSASLSSLFGSPTNAPRVQLDQLWLRFDMWRTLFITAGRQHVRWGTARFWTPADFLHDQRRNPLDVFDARHGTDMLKVHLPIESTAWNFYVYAIAGGHNDTPTLYSVSGAARAEIVAGSSELGLGALLRRGAKPRFEGDLSMALGPIDAYAEAALLDASEIDRVGFTPNAVLPDPQESSASAADQFMDRIKQAVETFYPVYRDHGYKPQIVGGLSLSSKYGDNDVFTLGVEYFYNGLGYADPNVYPGLLFPRANGLQDPASFFYLGQQYGAVYLLFPSPGALDLHTFGLSTLCNISDRSCITRFDYMVQVLTHLRFEMYIAGVYGRSDGEFRFGIQTPSIDGVKLGRQPAIFNAGLALRIGI